MCAKRAELDGEARERDLMGSARTARTLDPRQASAVAAAKAEAARAEADAEAAAAAKAATDPRVRH